ncbi:uncharacterized protein LOC131155125 [Malania oleifera]|uniref:uncharacterized protein LOC131155125 n=1 Tax=Malania oleifera TaxID=397392 RepID=UPI0025AE9B30|nr:uncharacterized protein LOC131155125 [Malania oleifera]XP_057964038.1 uncharacterized protein LOC131155125 [Malania oleifera]
MGFNSVYRALQDVFPQVDARMLKAVAIEHSKDADAAVEFILVEVLPFMTNPCLSSGSSFENQGFSDPINGGVESDIQNDSLGRYLAVEEEARAGPSSKSGSAASKVNDTSHTNNAIFSDSTLLEEDLNWSSVSKFYHANDGHDRVCGNTERKDLQKHLEVYVKEGPIQTSGSCSVTLMNEDCGVNSSLNNDFLADLIVPNEPVTNYFNHGENHLEVGNLLVQLTQAVIEHTTDSPRYTLQSESCLGQCSHVSPATLMQENGSIGRKLNEESHAVLGHSNGTVTNELKTARNDNGHCEHSTGDKLDVENYAIHLTQSSAREYMLDALECDLRFDSRTSIIESDKLQLNDSVAAASKEETSVDDTVDFGNGATLSPIVTGSGEVCRIDVLEDMIKDAKSNKKILFSAMELVINLMREVEHQEKAAEQAKEEASRGGIDILAKVEEMKQMLRHANVANDMHAGEVHGEKAILATEARELQARLLYLSDERDDSLSVLNEMQQTLEARLSAAEEGRKAAEQEKLHKENSARHALAEQELIMEKVVKESKILQQEAEENSKLREFLMDRGRLVDMLQGEISVICQDVRLLKEKFDERIPLSESVSSSQTTCILASSSSSLKSMASDRVPVLTDSSEAPKNTSPTPSVGNLTPKSSHGEGSRDDQKALSDDEWDLVRVGF